MPSCAAGQIEVTKRQPMFSVGTAFRLPVPIGRVWRLLVDIDRYGDWHPTLRFTNRPGDEERVDYVYALRSEEHTSELQSLMRISYAVLCLKKKRHNKKHIYIIIK